MNNLFNSIIIALLITSLSSCRGQSFTEGTETWDGIFEMSSVGDQKAKAQFDFEKKTGLLMLPDLIPIPLNLTEVVQQGDSIRFVIGFRSGPAYCFAVTANDSIKGMVKKEGLEDSPFWLARSSTNPINFVEKPAADAPYEITTFSGNEREEAVKQRLEQLVQKYDLEPYVFTKKIQIQEGAIPHSHPVLTLGVGDDTETRLLATFLHEQMHWYSLTKEKQFMKAGEVMLKKYPNVPADLPEGAGSEQSTFLHLGICYLEFHTLSQVIGREAALDHMQWMTTQYYRWVYRTLLEDMDEFEELFEQNDLHFK
ncbi:hypothetical protein [Roseivirga sp.]|uniref:hypothetical protein n=1 Tax=Roseivirga sp. TaxID=1964215 RepID=UPI003B520D95